MATDFIKKDKKQKTMLIISVLVILAVTLIVWLGFFGEEAPVNISGVSSVPLPESVEINFEIFKKIEKFQPFAFIEPLTGEAGRENPFLPY